MRTAAKFAAELAKFSLKNIKRLEVKFDPLHPSSGNVREFYQGATYKKHLRTNLECVVRAQVVADQSDPLVTVQFVDDHKLVLNARHLESGHIVKLIRQFGEAHKDDSDYV